MSVAKILDTLATRGLTLSLDGADLRLTGPEARIDTALVRLIREAKPQLVRHLSGLAGGQGAGRHPDADASFDLTPMQASYFYGRQGHFALGNISSHVYHEIEGSFDLAGLEQALSKVIARHAMLRTSFSSDATQTEHDVSEMPPVRIAVADLRAMTPSAQEAARRDIRGAMSHQVLAFDRAPLLDVRLTLLSDDAAVLHVSHDGLIMDGISTFLFFRDWHRCYLQPEAVDQPLKASFRDYVSALNAQRRTAGYRQARDYWIDRLATIAPHPQLPLRLDPARVQSPLTIRRTAMLDPAQWMDLKKHTAERSLTPNALLIAAYAEVLSLWGAQESFTLNITIANRLPIHPDVERMIGNFTDCLLLPIAADIESGFTERAAKIQCSLREALDHRQFSGIEVMRELGRRAGAAQAMPMPFTFNSTLGTTQSGVEGAAITAFGREVYAVSQTPQVFVNVFALENAGSLMIEFDSVDEVFPEGMISDLVSAYQRLLGALSAGADAWNRRDQNLLPAAQAERRRAANATTAPIPPGQAYEAFLRRAASTPDAIAVKTAALELTYGELCSGALAVARWLKTAGIARGEPVGVVMPKKWEQIVAILGAVMAGGAYVPIDPGLPAARIGELFAHGGVRYALVVAGTLALPDAAGQRLVIDDQFLAAGCRAETSTRRSDVLATEANQSELAYIIYTSGSTGAPKGVMVTHRSVVNLVADTNARFAIGSGDCLFAISAASFDLSVFDIFGGLSAGATLVLPDADKMADPQHWLEVATHAGVTVWNSVPAIVTLLADQCVATGSPLPPTLRLVMMSGDRIPAQLPARLKALKPDLQVISLGGPTETTVWNIFYPIAGPWSSPSIPYGKPNANNRAYILEGQMRECPDHVAGDLYAAGAGLASGYWQDPQQTAASFFDHAPLRERLYRTGDVARYLPDGNIELVGRSDFQVKLNGYRVELVEIETLLARCPGIACAAVVCRASAHGPRLVACLVASTNQDRSSLESEAQRILTEKLPDYMVPRQFEWMERLPLTSNNKLDRSALVKGVTATASTDSAIAADGADTATFATELVQHLAGIWADVLKLDTAGPASAFYQLGGTSLSGIRLLARIRKEIGVSVPLAELPRADTPRAMAAFIEQQRRPVTDLRTAAPAPCG